ncbi:hypothetical protein [Lyticum sinuosum]|uniref:Uncharacterized protein n=1 Tax=Lyticum sinuosum TaxID=1332059 RepID=A0AAE5AGZ0_9RICK|nr:hypothetical protein [Lyticum sinuosum]MDZ5760965.1 hypothetical protein [Lyticum sinuosum]
MIKKNSNNIKEDIKYQIESERDFIEVELKNLKDNFDIIDRQKILLLNLSSKIEEKQILIENLKKNQERKNNDIYDYQDQYSDIKISDTNETLDNSNEIVKIDTESDLNLINESNFLNSINENSIIQDLNQQDDLASILDILNKADQTDQIDQADQIDQTKEILFLQPEESKINYDFQKSEELKSYSVDSGQKSFYTAKSNFSEIGKDREELFYSVDSGQKSFHTAKSNFSEKVNDEEELIAQNFLQLKKEIEKTEKINKIKDLKDNFQDYHIVGSNNNAEINKKTEKETPLIKKDKVTQKKLRDSISRENQEIEKENIISLEKEISSMKDEEKKLRDSINQEIESNENRLFMLNQLLTDDKKIKKFKEEVKNININNLIRNSENRLFQLNQLLTNDKKIKNSKAKIEEINYELSKTDNKNEDTIKDLRARLKLQKNKLDFLERKKYNLYIDYNYPISKRTFLISNISLSIKIFFYNLFLSLKKIIRNRFFSRSTSVGIDVMKKRSGVVETRKFERIISKKINKVECRISSLKEQIKKELDIIRYNIRLEENMKRTTQTNVSDNITIKNIKEKDLKSGKLDNLRREMNEFIKELEMLKRTARNVNIDNNFLFIRKILLIGKPLFYLITTSGKFLSKQCNYIKDKITLCLNSILNKFLNKNNKTNIL